MAKNKAKKQDLNKKVAKELKRNKNVETRSEGEVLARKFLILLVIIVVVILGLYFGTSALIESRNNTTDNSTTGKVNTDVVTVGMMLNRPYDEYYVLAYNSEDVEAIYYSSLLTTYQQIGTSKLYFCDLNNSLNDKFNANGGESNPEAKEINELKLGKITLLKIKKGKIVKYIEDIEEIESILK